MKKSILFIIFILFFRISFSFTPTVSDNLTLNNKFKNKTIKLNPNYQQFKSQLINFESNDLVNYNYIKKRRRKKKNDNLMLYVAGGLAVATGVLILANDPENFVSNSTSGVNLGIAAGGTIASGMIVAKFFIDKRR